jgi:hypothetical protein
MPRRGAQPAIMELLLASLRYQFAWGQPIAEELDVAFDITIQGKAKLMMRGVEHSPMKINDFSSVILDSIFVKNLF